MKQLMIVRHAKAGWGDPGLADFQRPLNKRGVSDSLVMAQHLLDKSIVPQYIVSSPALRALTTAKQFAKTLGIKTADFATDKCIYEANSNTLLDVVWGLDDRHDKIMLVGHNPGLFDMVRSLVAQNIDELSTCEVIAIQFDCDQWHKIDSRSGATFFNAAPQK
ncbi:MAG: histidine phosphatase family protein [Thiotrichales bacterium]|nr:histidine phosphatase family protein [Thiotrichales bacterium]